MLSIFLGDVRAIYAELYIISSNLILYLTKIESFMNFQQYIYLLITKKKIIAFRINLKLLIDWN